MEYRFASRVSEGGIRPDTIGDISLEVIKRRADGQKVVSLAPGSPDMRLLRPDLLSKLAAGVTDTHGDIIWQYGHPQGMPSLRAKLAPVLTKVNGLVECTPARLHIATGAQHAMRSAMEVFVEPGDTVLVEEQSFPAAHNAARACGGNIAGVASDEQGMLPEALEQAVEEHGAKLVYIMPSFQNPTGRTMSIERRQQIADVLKRHGVMAIEDGVYDLLALDGETRPPLQSFAPDNVVYVGSFTKIISPGMRVGWAVANEEVIQQMNLVRQSGDMHTPGPNQAILENFLEGEQLDEQITCIRAAGVGRLVTMHNALLENDFDKRGVRWRIPPGGMFLWLEAPEGVDTLALRKSAMEKGVAIMEDIFSVDPPAPLRHFRLSFLNNNEEDIKTGVKLLADLLPEPTYELETVKPGLVDRWRALIVQG